jgi:hypothetical protein
MGMALTTGMKCLARFLEGVHYLGSGYACGDETERSFISGVTSATRLGVLGLTARNMMSASLQPQVLAEP